MKKNLSPMLPFSYDYFPITLFYNHRNTGFEEMLHEERNAHGRFTPAAVAPRCDNPRTGTTSLSLSAGAVRGDK